MSSVEISYPIAKFGLATSFVESETPPHYALKYRNRFTNAVGGAEKRRGIVHQWNTVPGNPSLSGIHELVDKNGTETLLVSDAGSIYAASGSAFSQVFTGWDTSARIRSIQSDDKLIFFNGVDRNIYTTDASAFQRLLPVIEEGVLTGDTSAAGVKDSNVSAWNQNTNVVINDLVYNKTLEAYGIVNFAPVSAQVRHTTIGSAQATGLGVASRNQDAGDSYKILDLVELNIIDVNGVLDNTSSNTSGSNATTIKVNGVDFSTTDIRVGDFVRNTTRTAVAKVSAIAASALTVTSVASQTGGDSLIFLKEAMPITEDAHVHFGRAYFIDARDQTKVRITGIDDPEDLTTDAGTLNANTFSFGDLQPKGDIAVGMESFQRFFCIGGKNNLFMYSGTDPIVDTSGSSDFDIVGLFPQGVVTKDAMLSIGNELVFLTPDGVQTASLNQDSQTINRANLSEAIKTTLRDLIEDVSPNQIQVLHYPRRSWFMLKIGSEIYVFNYTKAYGQDQPLLDESAGQLSNQIGSWSLFDGKLAQQSAYFVRRNGDLVCAGGGGKVYKFDVEGVYSDDGEVYTTEYQSAWDDMTGLVRRYHDVKTKQIEAVKPIFEAGAETSYTITLEGGFDRSSTETITVGVSGGAASIGTAVIPFVIGGAGTQNTKYPVRARGEQYRVSFKTEDAVGPDILSRYTLYINPYGRR